MLAAVSHAVAVLIEAAGSVLLVGFVLAAGGALLRGGGLERARLLIAEGAVLALSFKTGATLLKTIDLPTWDRIAAFAAVLALRTVLKRAEEQRVAEQERLAEEKARAAWDSQEPMPEENPINRPRSKKRKFPRVSVPIIDEPPFYHSRVSIRRLTHTIPHITERCDSGFHPVRQEYVNELPYRRVPGWSGPSRCTSRRPSTLEKLREKSKQLRGL